LFLSLILTSENLLQFTMVITNLLGNFARLSVRRVKALNHISCTEVTDDFVHDCKHCDIQFYIMVFPLQRIEEVLGNFYHTMHAL